MERVTDIAERFTDDHVLEGLDLKQVRSRVSTRRLLRAAAELIAERGYEKTTLAAIGERAGYSHGLVTRRFGSKDGLLLALLQKMVSDWMTDDILPAFQGQSGVDSVLVLVRGIRGSAAHDPTAMRALYTLMFEGLKPEPAILHERMAEIHRGGRLRMEDALNRGIAEGNVHPSVDARTTSQLVMAALRGSAYQWLLDGSFDFDGTLRALEMHIERTLRV